MRFYEKIVIKDEYITLGQLLKFTGIIGSGAMAKSFILDNKIYVNGELETRRGENCTKAM